MVDESLRLTWQVSPRNKVTAFWDEQLQNEGRRRRQPDDLARGTRGPRFRRIRVYQAQWTSPVSSRVLLEAAFSGMGFSYGREKPGNNHEYPLHVDQVGPITFVR